MEEIVPEIFTVKTGSKNLKGSLNSKQKLQKILLTFRHILKKRLDTMYEHTAYQLPEGLTKTNNDEGLGDFLSATQKQMMTEKHLQPWREKDATGKTNNSMGL